MNRISSKHTNLIPVHISSRLHWLLICLCLIPITGCVTQATPDTWNLEIQDDAPPLLPNLSLVRRVVPEVSTKSYTGWNFQTNDLVREVSESRFGDPDEDADLSCVNTGLKKALPDIDIVPRTTFWEQIAAPHDTIRLSELFVAPQVDRLSASQAEVIVVAYHTEVDVESTKMESLIEGAYSDTDRETAAIIVIDLHRKAIIHSSKISFEDSHFIYHFVTIPFGGFTRDPPDICNTIGRQAGTAIAEAMPGRPVRALVVVAGKDPYEAAQLTPHSYTEALLGAVKFPDLPEVKWLIDEGVDVNAEDQNGNTPLRVAASEGRVAIAKLLISNGADVTLQNWYGRTPLHEAVTWYGQVGVAELLLANGADVNARDSNGATPLHAAVTRGDVVSIKFLLMNGASVNSRDGDSETPLHTAIRNSQAAVVDLLLTHGADANARGSYYNSSRLPVGMARGLGGREDIIELLRQHGGKE